MVSLLGGMLQVAGAELLLLRSPSSLSRRRTNAFAGNAERS
jgi:hypothetical protein